MSLTLKQRNAVIDSYETLKNRGMVFFSGEANGKTRTISRVQELAPRKVAPGKVVLKARHKEDNDIEFVTGAFYGRSDKINPYQFMRQILIAKGRKPVAGAWAVVQQFEGLLIEFQNEGRVLCLAVDNADLLCGRSFTILKYLNEIRHGGKDIGCAVAVAGEFGKMKMPMPFQKRCHEICLDMKDFTIEELAQMIETHWPGQAASFSRPALEAIRRGAGSMLELRNRATRVVGEMRELAQDEATPALVQVALAKAA